MIRTIDNLLNKITMYRLVLYELIGLLVVAGILGFFKLVPIDPVYLGYSTIVIFVVAWVVNKIFAFFFEAPSNPESTYITALILALVIAPPLSYGDLSFFALAGWAAAWAMASKYLFAIKQKHLFNPAAFGIAVTALFLSQSATWWVGTLWMLPFVAVGGFLVARKIRRLDMVAIFGVTIVAVISILSSGEGSGVFHIIQQSLLYAPAVFLGTVMLTEPLTTPPTRFLRLWYAVLVGFLFAPEVHIGSFYFTPEIALLVGNLFVYVVSPKTKLLLTLKDRVLLAPNTYEFVFASNRKLNFTAGQYLEWTLAHKKRDGRGIRRYFTIASAPDDSDIRIGVKFYKPTSSFKKSLLSMKRGDPLVAAQLAGDFVLPRDTKKKLVFIAGGIGITPFASMLRHLLATGEKRPITIFYANNTTQDIAYVELLGRAEQELDLTIVPIITTAANPAAPEFPATLTPALIRAEVPEYKNSYYYLSGPQGMVNAYSDLLGQMNVPQSHIKRDFFPGFA